MLLLLTPSSLKVCLAGQHRIVAKQILKYIENLELHQNGCNLVVLGMRTLSVVM